MPEDYVTWCPVLAVMVQLTPKAKKALAFEASVWRADLKQNVRKHTPESYNDGR